jgi:hypothetical protein
MYIKKMKGNERIRVCLVQPRRRGGEGRCGERFLRRGDEVKYNLLC